MKIGLAHVSINSLNFLVNFLRGTQLVSIIFLLFVHLAGFASENRSLYRVTPQDYGVTLASTALAIVRFEPRNTTPPRSRAGLMGIDRTVIGNRNSTIDDWSTALVATTVTLPVILDFNDRGLTSDFREDAVVFSEVIATQFALGNLVKNWVSRPRPRVYAGEDMGSEGYRSFFSSHTSTAFSALGVSAYTLYQRYNTQAWPWWVMVGVGGAVGAGRILAGMHFYTDVVAGAAVGSAMGILIPMLHRRTENSPTSIHLMPSPSGGLIQLSYALSP